MSVDTIERTQSKPGRPRAYIDWDRVAFLLEAGCSAQSIAEEMGIARNVLYDRCQRDNNIDFSTFTRQNALKGEHLLHKTQYETALSGNVPMLIWVGKNRLGQSDKQEIEHTNKSLEALVNAHIQLLQQKNLVVDGMVYVDDEPVEAETYVKRLLSGYEPDR